MYQIETSEFVKSEQAKKLPEIIPIDEEFAYILGLWKADRCSSAKGIVGLRSKDIELIERFKEFLRKLGLATKERTVMGYGLTREIYSCSMPLRRIFETISSKRTDIFTTEEILLAYFAGLVDGNGSTGDMSHLEIYYSKDEKEDTEKDAKLLTRLGFSTTLKDKKSYFRLYILKPHKLIQKLSDILVLKRKLRLARPSSETHITCC